MMARRVGFVLTPSRRSSASGWIAAATSQNAAPDGSAGTVSSTRRDRGRAGQPDRRGGRRPPSPRRTATPRARSIRSVWSRVATASVTRVSPSAASARQQDRGLHLGAGNGRRVVDGRERRPARHGQRQQRVAAARPANDGAHRAQRLHDAAHRPAPERRVPVEDREQRPPGEQPGDQAGRRPGVAAVEDPLGLGEGVAARATRRGSRRARRARRRARPCAPSAAHHAGGGPDVLAVAGRGDPALALGQQRQEQRAVGDRLVAGQRRTAAQPRGGADDDARPAVSALPVAGRGAAGRSRSPWRSRTCAWTPVIAAIIDSKPAKSSCCSASESASSGRGWTSTMIPSAPDRHAADRERLDQPALAGGVRRVDDDRQVRQVVHQRHRREVQRVARGRLERPDAALAQDDLRVAGRGDVLGGHQPLLDRGAEAALEHHRPARAPAREQQREVLHVARADLEDVRVLGHDVDLVGLHHLGDHRQPGPLARLREVAQALDAQALEAVRARARLERAAADDRRAVARDEVDGLDQLVAALDRARARPSPSATPSPIAASSTRITVFSGWNSRETSL